MNKLASTIILLFCAGAASADGPSYSYAQLSYGTYLSADDVLGFNVDGSVFGVSVSVEASEYLFVRGGYRKEEVEISVLDIDLTSFVAEIGFHNDLSSTTDFVATIGFTDARGKSAAVGRFGFFGAAEAGFADGFIVAPRSVSESAALASIGLRSMISKRFELYGSVAYVDFDNSQSAVSAGAVYSFNDTFALGLEVSRSDGTTVAGLGARLYFGY
jgi:hypothetical protein